MHALPLAWRRLPRRRLACGDVVHVATSCTCTRRCERDWLTGVSPAWREQSNIWATTFSDGRPSYSPDESPERGKLVGEHQRGRCVFRTGASGSHKKRGQWRRWAVGDFILLFAFIALDRFKKYTWDPSHFVHCAGTKGSEAAILLECC
jgi:hypothetical protein